MVQGKFYAGQEDLSVIKDIRRRVFSEPSMWEDEQDVMCMHVTAMEQGKPTACGRIYYDGFECVISLVAVLPEYQGQKFGDFVVRMLIDKALMSGVDEIKLLSPKDTVGFFEKIGFLTQESADRSGELVTMILRKENIYKCCGCHESNQ